MGRPAVVISRQIVFCSVEEGDLKKKFQELEALLAADKTLNRRAFDSAAGEPEAQPDSLQALRDELANCQVENGALHRELAVQLGRVSDLQAELAESQMQCDKLQRELANQKQDNDQAALVLEELEAAYDAERHNHLELQSRIGSLKSKSAMDKQAHAAVVSELKDDIALASAMHRPEGEPSARVHVQLDARAHPVRDGGDSAPLAAPLGTPGPGQPQHGALSPRGSSGDRGDRDTPRSLNDSDAEWGAVSTPPSPDDGTLKGPASDVAQLRTASSAAWARVGSLGDELDRLLQSPGTGAEDINRVALLRLAVRQEAEALDSKISQRMKT